MAPFKHKVDVNRARTPPTHWLSGIMTPMMLDLGWGCSMAKKSKQRKSNTKRAVKKTKSRKQPAAKKKKSGKTGRRIRIPDTSLAGTAPQYTNSTFDPNKGGYVEFIVEYNDGRKESMFIENSTLSRGDHVAGTVARDGQRVGTLPAGKINKVTRKI